MTIHYGLFDWLMFADDWLGGYAIQCISYHHPWAGNSSSITRGWWSYLHFLCLEIVFFSWVCWGLILPLEMKLSSPYQRHIGKHVKTSESLIPESCVKNSAKLSPLMTRNVASRYMFSMALVIWTGDIQLSKKLMSVLSKACFQQSK